jgi:peptide/nickel transport system permease protein
MQRWRRFGYLLLLSVPVVFGILVLNFFLIHLAPGDPASVLAGEGGAASPEYMAALRLKFGLDRSLTEQLLSYIGNALHFNLGYSYGNDEPVFQLIMERLWPTLLLMLTAFVFALTGGITLGLLAASARNKLRDAVISFVSLICYATPGFWLGLMLIVVFAIKLGWLPTSGLEDIGAFNEGWARVADIARHLILPGSTLGMFYLALYTRLMRASMLEQIGMDYVVTARSKGLSERQIVFGHMMRNAMLPVVTMAGLQAGNLIGGSVIVETVFGWPGLGTLAFDALQSRDLNLLLGIFFISACLVVVINLLIDLIYVALDPRIQMR